MYNLLSTEVSIAGSPEQPGLNARTVATSAFLCQLLSTLAYVPLL